uniref:(California timema) hypothetical protein n=1 Tax=Timema californicum TaxID=61474 RepID=A0A7R9J605_TIMCA|nr:unnamed protein product [Timema californicum]
MLLLYLSLPRSTPVSLHPSSSHIVSQHQHIVFSTPNELSKQEFDIEARKLLSGSSSKIQLHNMFLLYLFRKCQGLASSPIQPQHTHHSSKTSGRISSNSSSKNKDQRHSRSDKVAFEPADILDYGYVAKTSTKHTEEPPIRYCAQELFIPNTSLIMGRLLLATWEHDLEGADDKCADILGLAVKSLHNVHGEMAQKM